MIQKYLIISLLLGSLSLQAMQKDAAQSKKRPLDGVVEQESPSKKQRVESSSSSQAQQAEQSKLPQDELKETQEHTILTGMQDMHIKVCKTAVKSIIAALEKKSSVRYVASYEESRVFKGDAKKSYWLLSEQTKQPIEQSLLQALASKKIDKYCFILDSSEYQDIVPSQQVGMYVRPDSPVILFSINYTLFGKLPPAVQKHIFDWQLAVFLNTNNRKPVGRQAAAIRSIVQVTDKATNKLEHLLYDLQKKLKIEADIWLADSPYQKKDFDTVDKSFLRHSNAVVCSTDKESYKQYVIHVDRDYISGLGDDVARFFLLHELGHIQQLHLKHRHECSKMLKECSTEQELLEHNLFIVQQQLGQEIEADTIAASFDKQACLGGIRYFLLSVEHNSVKNSKKIEHMPTHPSDIFRLHNLKTLYGQLYVSSSFKGAS